MQTLIFSHPQCSFFQWPGRHVPPRTQWTGIQCAHSSHHRQWAVLKLGFGYRALQHLVETVLLKLAKVCLRCIYTHKHKHCLANGHTNENDPDWDSDHLKHLLPPFFCQKNSNSTNALVISRPKELEAIVFSNYLLNAFHFPPGLLETTQVHSSPRHCLHHFTCFLLHRAHINCANTKRFWAFAGFANRAQPCSSTPPSCQAGDAIDYSMVAGTA